MILAVLFFVLAAPLGVATVVSHRRRRASLAPAPFDAARAREESYRLGLPFPESDGTLSVAQPPEERDAVIAAHRAMHARRWAAEESSCVRHRKDCQMTFYR